MPVEVVDQVARDEIAALSASISNPQIVLDVDVEHLALQHTIEHNLNNLNLFWAVNANWPAGAYEVSRDANTIIIGFTGEVPEDAAMKVRLY